MNPCTWNCWPTSAAPSFAATPDLRLRPCCRDLAGARPARPGPRPPALVHAAGHARPRRVRVAHVRRRRTDAMSRGMPIIEAMTGRRSAPTIIGRDRELDIVTGRLDAALEGSLTHLLVAGEAGIGKTRLVAETSRLAAERGMRVLLGASADIGEGGVPYGPIVEALRASSRGLAPSDHRPRSSVPSGDDLARLVPALSPARRAVDAHESSSRRRPGCSTGSSASSSGWPRCGRCCSSWRTSTGRTPATREAIAFLARQLRHGPRPAAHDVPRRRAPPAPPAAAVDRRARAERAGRAGRRSERLDAAQTAALLERDPRRAADAVASWTGSTGGRTATRSSSRSSWGPATKARGSGRCPPTLREVLADPHRRPLPDAAQRVVHVAAVAGRRVDHDLLAEVAGMDEAALIEGLRAAVGGPRPRDVRGLRRRASRATTRSATRCSRRRPTTTCCPASASGSTARSPRSSATRGPGRGRIRGAATGRSSPGTWSAARDDPPGVRGLGARRRRGGPATYAFADAAAARRAGARAVVRASTTPRRSRDGPGRPSSTWSRRPRGCGRQPAVGRAAAGGDRRAGRGVTRSGWGSPRSGSGGRCGITATRREALAAHDDGDRADPGRSADAPSSRASWRATARSSCCVDHWTEATEVPVARRSTSPGGPAPARPRATPATRSGCDLAVGGLYREAVRIARGAPSAIAHEIGEPGRHRPGLRRTCASAYRYAAAIRPVASRSSGAVSASRRASSGWIARTPTSSAPTACECLRPGSTWDEAHGAGRWRSIAVPGRRPRHIRR